MLSPFCLFVLQTLGDLCQVIRVVTSSLPRTDRAKLCFCFSTPTESRRHREEERWLSVKPQRAARNMHSESAVIAPGVAHTPSYNNYTMHRASFTLVWRFHEIFDCGSLIRVQCNKLYNCKVMHEHTADKVDVEKWIKLTDGVTESVELGTWCVSLCTAYRSHSLISSPQPLITAGSCIVNTSHRFVTERRVVFFSQCLAAVFVSVPCPRTKTVPG